MAAKIILKADSQEEMSQLCMDYLGAEIIENGAEKAIKTTNQTMECVSALNLKQSEELDFFNFLKIKDIIANPRQLEMYKSVVHLLKNYKNYVKRHAEIPKGVLIYGNEKSLLDVAYAIANEAGAEKHLFSSLDFNVSTSTAVQKTCDTINKVFQQAIEQRKQKPVVIIINQIDKLASNISYSYFNMLKLSNDLTILNCLLCNIDLIVNDEIDLYPVMVIATSNSSINLNSQLFEPGRFEYKIFVELPTLKYRIDILESAFYEEKNLDKELIINIAKRTRSYSAQMLYDLTNKIKIQCIQSNSKKITIEHINEVFSSLYSGHRTEPNDMEELKKTAIHETGHALIAILYGMNVSEISIVGRATSKGYVSYIGELPENSSHTFKSLKNIIRLMLASLAAESFECNTTTSGVSADLMYATEIALMAVAIYGMSEKIGPINLENSILLDAAKEDIYHEVQRLLKESLEEAKELIKKYQKQFKLLWTALLAKKYMSLEEALVIVGKELNGIENKEKIKN